MGLFKHLLSKISDEIDKHAEDAQSYEDFLAEFDTEPDDLPEELPWMDLGSESDSDSDDYLNSEDDHDNNLKKPLYAAYKGETFRDNEMLYRWDSDDDDVRREAVQRITDEDILFKMVLREQCEDILLDALRKISDTKYLELISKKADSIDVRMKAIGKLREGFGTFVTSPKRKWIHVGSIKRRGPEISIALGGAKVAQRIKAVEVLKDQRVLSIVAENDDRPEVRKAAVKKLTDLVDLENIIKKERDEDVLNAAVEAYYNADKIKYDEFGENPKTMMTPEIAGKATDQDLLRRIAENTIDFNTREAAFNNIWDIDVLHSIYARKLNYDLRDQYVLFDRAIEHMLQSNDRVNEFALKGDVHAIRKLLDSDVINEVALDRKRDDYSRILAIKRICDFETVKSIANDTTEKQDIREAAKNKLTAKMSPDDISKLSGIIDASDGTSDRYIETLHAIEKLSDEDKLFEYAMEERQFPFSYVINLGYVYCIDEIIGKIYSREYLLEIATQSPIERNRFLAAERVNSEDIRQVYIASMGDIDVRRVCARREQNEEQLYYYALDDTDSFVREISAYRMTDNELLKKLAILSEDETVQRIALSRMTSQHDIAIVAENAHTIAIRQVAVNHKLLTNTKILSDIVLNDSNCIVSLDALNKIYDEDCLGDIVIESKDDLIRYSAIKKISNEEKLKYVYKMIYADRDARKEVIEKVEDEEFLALAAITEFDANLAVKAAEKVKEQSLLMSIIKGSDNLDVKHKALERLTGRKDITEVYESSEPVSIRQEAGYMLFGSKMLRDEAEKEDANEPDAVNHEKEDFIRKVIDLPDSEQPILKFITRADSSPLGKSNIYLTSEDGDLSKFGFNIAQDILKKQNCAIWYLEPGTKYDEEEYFTDLSQMQLFVIPITKQFLRTENRARLVDFKYALDNQKAILPVLVESGLEEEFNTVCGELHTINAVMNDITAKSYEERIEEFLSNILIGDEFIEKIRKAFDAYIFLSYRKKDRLLAHELMKLIHKNDFCRDIAIWYDEFLVPGVNFNEAIYDALEKSQIFALVVTPNLVKETNYIMTTEYPFAIRMEKQILPFEMKKLGSKETKDLEKFYENIGSRINPHDELMVSDKLKEIIREYAVSTSKKDAVHDFFIGLAYLSGIDVEIDRERALELISSASDAGVAPSTMKLVQMYRYGEGVKRDIEKVIEYQRRLVSQLEGELIRESSSADRKQFVQALISLSEFIVEYIVKNGVRSQSTGNTKGMDKLYKEAEDSLKKAMYLARTFNRCGKDDWAAVKMAESISNLGDMYALKGDWIEAQKYFSKNLMAFEEGSMPENRMLIGKTYTQIGRNALHENSSFVAQDYFSEAVLTFEKEYEESKSIESREGLAEAWAYLGDAYLCDEEFDNADICYDNAIKMSETLMEELNTEASKVRYDGFMEKRSKLYESFLKRDNTSKFLVMADSHNDKTSVERVVRKYYEEVDAVIHLGDGLDEFIVVMDDTPGMMRYYVVGNHEGNAFSWNHTYQDYLEICGHRILLTHGDRFNVKLDLKELVYMAKRDNYDIVLFGHTHIKLDETIDGVRLINPGAIHYNRDDKPSYALLEISDDGVKVRFEELN